MAQSKREKYERKRAHIRELADAHEQAAKGEVPASKDWPFMLPDEADEILRWCDGYDEENAVVTPNDADSEENRWGSTRKPSTLHSWLAGVSCFARDLDGSILDASAKDLNQVAQRLYEGDAQSVSKGLSKNSVKTRQDALTKFVRHVDNDTSPDDITVFDQQSTVVDPEDMLSREEFHALRNAAEHPRDKCIVDLFLYTGQRNTGLRTLRIKDIDLDDAKYRLNRNADGLKGADLIGTWNPLLGSVGSIRDWLSHHPEPDNPDAYLLTARTNNIHCDPSSPISGDTVNRVLRKAAKKAAEEYPGIGNKPTHAHAMRHNFVTMAKRDYDLDDDVIKRLIRHKPESDVMTTTYKHLSDEDYIRKAEEAFGLREEEDHSPMTPEHCDVCREPLAPGAKACPNCGTVFTPDAKAAQDQMQEEAESQIVEVEDEQEAKIVKGILQDLRENPGQFVDDE